MVKEFLDYLNLVQKKFIETIPLEIFDAINRINIMLKTKFSKDKLKLNSYKNFLERFTQEMV